MRGACSVAALCKSRRSSYGWTCSCKSRQWISVIPFYRTAHQARTDSGSIGSQRKSVAHILTFCPAAVRNLSVVHVRSIQRIKRDKSFGRAFSKKLAGSLKAEPLVALRRVQTLYRQARSLGELENLLQEKRFSKTGLQVETIPKIIRWMIFERGWAWRTPFCLRGKRRVVKRKLKIRKGWPRRSALSVFEVLH